MASKSFNSNLVEDSLLASIRLSALASKRASWWAFQHNTGTFRCTAGNRCTRSALACGIVMAASHSRPTADPKSSGASTHFLHSGSFQRKSLVSFQRNTKQRTQIIDLLQKTDEFLSASEVREKLSHSGIEIGLSTVYRTLSSLLESDELDVFIKDDGETVYRWCSKEHHHHLQCRVCGKTIEIQTTDFEEWALKIAKKYKFRDVEHTFEITGTCQDCD